MDHIILKCKAIIIYAGLIRFTAAAIGNAKAAVAKNVAIKDKNNKAIVVNNNNTAITAATDVFNN